MASFGAADIAGMELKAAMAICPASPRRQHRIEPLRADEVKSRGKFKNTGKGQAGAIFCHGRGNGYRCKSTMRGRRRENVGQWNAVENGRSREWTGLQVKTQKYCKVGSAQCRRPVRCRKEDCGGGQMRTLQATAVWGWVYVPGLQAPASSHKVTKSHPGSQSVSRPP